MTDKPIDAATALDQFFALVREEALSNPRFAARLVEAVGYNVLFTGKRLSMPLILSRSLCRGRKYFVIPSSPSSLRH